MARTWMRARRRREEVEVKSPAVSAGLALPHTARNGPLAAPALTEHGEPVYNPSRLG